MRDRFIRVYKNSDPSHIASRAASALAEGQGVVLIGPGSRRRRVIQSCEEVQRSVDGARFFVTHNDEPARTLAFIWVGERRPAYTYWSNATSSGPALVDFSHPPDRDDSFGIEPSSNRRRVDIDPLENGREERPFPLER